MNISRRGFLGSVAAIGSAAAADACAVEPRRVQVTRHDLAVAGLPSALDGARIAQISDTHLPHNGAAVRAAARIIARERPEIVVLTGDICESAASLGALVEFVSEVRGSVATFGIYGNWERKAGITRRMLSDAYERAGAELLVSRGVAVERGGARIGIVGLDDALYAAPNLPAALRHGETAADIWLVHCPAFADRIPAAITARPAAMLAGHTHGGQIRVPGWTPYTPIGSGAYVEGWYRTAGVSLYVSRGVGTVVLPARFCCPAELPVFTLRATTAGLSPDSPRTGQRPSA